LISLFLFIVRGLRTSKQATSQGEESRAQGSGQKEQRRQRKVGHTQQEPHGRGKHERCAVRVVKGDRARGYFKDWQDER
jgi:hypothetical protein